MVNGVGNKESASYRHTNSGELIIPGETLLILPENKLQEINFDVSKTASKPKEFYFSHGSEKLTARRLKSFNFLNKVETVRALNALVLLKPLCPDLLILSILTKHEKLPPGKSGTAGNIKRSVKFHHPGT